MHWKLGGVHWTLYAYPKNTVSIDLCGLLFISQCSALRAQKHFHVILSGSEGMRP